jgi:SAM-dependent methyltransferase
VTTDPLAGSPWSAPGTVSGFAQSAPNATLLRFAQDQLAARPLPRVVDLGCGAARNAAPLAQLGCKVLGVDLSWPMLQAAHARALAEHVDDRIDLVMSPMDALPIAGATADLVVAHGIWNLARSDAEFRAALEEAARIAKHGAGLFVFTFSRHTLPPGAEPVSGEAFVFTQFSGQPQCFLTDAELISELAAVGFEPDARVPLTEHNRPPSGAIIRTGTPVIYEGAFRRLS